MIQCAYSMKEVPEDLNDFPVPITVLLLKRANEIWDDAYNDCTPSRITIPDLETLLTDSILLDTLQCMNVESADDIIAQLKEFNTLRADAIGAGINSKRSRLPMYGILFERPVKEKEEEFPF